MTSQISIPMKDPGDYIEKHQCETLERNADSPRNKIIIALLWRAGLRASEVINLKKKDFIINEEHLRESTINVLSLKKKAKVREPVPLMLEIIPDLERYLIRFTPDAYIFPSWSKSGHISRVWVQKIVRKACEKSKITHAKNSERIHPHTLRHSMAIHMIKKKVKLPMIQAFLRHTSLTSTTYYLRFDYDEVAREFHRAMESD